MHAKENGIQIVILPRISLTWEQFVARFPEGNCIALDGVVSGGPRFDPKTNHLNFDHHDGVVREATMSTCMQVYYALKNGLIEAFRRNGRVVMTIVINDFDQDTSLTVWELRCYHLFEGIQSIPHINRLIELTNRLDITGGAFPMNLREQLLAQQNWVFAPYTDLRKSGALAIATEEVLRSGLEAVIARLDKFLMQQGGEEELDIRHEILYDSPHFKIVDEIGGNTARYHLFAHGMNAFVSLVARRPDGRFVYTIGRRSRYIRFPVPALYNDLNAAEGFGEIGWNGSDIIGGSPRQLGSGLSWEAIRDIVNERLRQDRLI